MIYAGQMGNWHLWSFHGQHDICVFHAWYNQLTREWMVFRRDDHDAATLAALELPLQG